MLSLFVLCREVCSSCKGTEVIPKETSVSHPNSSCEISRGDAESAGLGNDKRSERKTRMDARRTWSCVVLGLTIRNLHNMVGGYIIGTGCAPPPKLSKLGI